MGKKAAKKAKKGITDPRTSLKAGKDAHVTDEAGKYVKDEAGNKIPKLDANGNPLKKGKILGDKDKFTADYKKQLDAPSGKKKKTKVVPVAATGWKRKNPEELAAY